MAKRKTTKRKTTKRKTTRKTTKRKTTKRKTKRISAVGYSARLRKKQGLNKKQKNPKHKAVRKTTCKFCGKLHSVNIHRHHGYGSYARARGLN